MAFAFPADDGAPSTDSPGGEPSGESTRRYGHFDIDAGADGHPVELGAGAMATTYRATDSVLHSAVALKVINQKVAEHPSARARFLREARAAAKLHHPNVASVSHYGEQDGECYYVMELVEGETLDARVRSVGPLPPALAVEIGVQVARALAAAEACGVVHRDLKPSNIMLTTPQGEKTGGNASTVVKVIDWGLAKAVSAESALGTDHTHGGFVGTPAFASPEQFPRAKTRRIDHRADIYSLGVTLWYLLCGRTPFTGATLEEIHSRQVEHPIPLAQLTAARVPTRIVALLKSMMAVDPGKRPQSARELLEALRDCQEHFPVEGISDASRRARRRGWTVGVVLLVVCTLAALATGWFLHRPSSVPAGSSIAVLPLENLSPKPGDAFFTAGIQDAITADLARISRLKVISPESVKSYATGKPRDLAAIGRALGVDHLLEGSVRRDGERVRIELRLTETGGPARKWTAQYERPLSEEFAMLGEITRVIAGRLHTPPSPDELSVIDQRPTHDPIAYDLYLQALALPTIFRTQTELRESSRQRIALLESAVARDPGFALAYGALVTLHDDIVVNYQEASAEELAVDHRSLAESALARARNLQPDNGDTHLRAASHYFLATHDLEQARIELDLARRTLPNSAKLENLSGRIAFKQGRYDDVIRPLEKSATLNPRSIRAHLDLAFMCNYLRRYDQADQEFAALALLVPHDAVPTFTIMRALLKLESHADLKPVRAATAEWTDADDPDHRFRDQFELLLALFGRDETKLRFVLLASKKPSYLIANFEYPAAWFEALAARLRGDDVAARAAFGTARGEVEKKVAAAPRDERNLLLLAMIDAGLGRKEEAVREAQLACTMTPADTDDEVGPSDRCCLAVVYAWTNQKDLALTELEKLVAGPAGANIPCQPTYGDLKLNPLWDVLRSEPRFAALVQRLAPANPNP